MHFFQFIFICLYLAVYKSYELSGAPLPAVLKPVNLYVTGAFLAWSAWTALRIIVDCIRSYSSNEMSAENMRSGIALALFHVLPTLLLSVFMLTESFREN